MIKARACAGDIAAGEAVLHELAPFVWRKYLDFVALADVHAMKRQINAYRGHGEIAVEGHNIKLGRGGIREIEFFAQTQQLIAGGRNPALRDRDTLTTLDKLCADKWIDAEARDAMKEAYGFLRVVEHRLQMMNDEQTQSLPSDRADLERFARFLGFKDRDDFAVVLLGRRERVAGDARTNLDRWVKQRGRIVEIEDVPDAVGRRDQGHAVGLERMADHFRLRDDPDRPEPAVPEAPRHHQPAVAPDDVRRVEPGAHSEDARPLGGDVDPVIARQALGSRSVD